MEGVGRCRQQAWKQQDFVTCLEALCAQLHASSLHCISTYVYLRHSLEKSALISPLPIVYIVMAKAT